MSGVRVRFAPSPTGYLHVGGARTALFNHLFARHEGGRFVLRIEDTDVERSSAELDEMMIRDLSWLGLDWDEGPDVDGPHGPYRQSERIAIYGEYAARLVSDGAAFPCFCTDDELARKREEAAKAGRPPRYDGSCRHLGREERERLRKEGRPESVRFRVEAEEGVSLDDLIRGEVAFPPDMAGDFVILRSNGLPTYNFAAVVDDALMEITHVIRGEEHLPNTFRQLLLYDALGFGRPRFAHIPLILGPDRSKLSKRHGAPNIKDFREQGYPAEAVVNYLAFLGWSPKDEREIFSPEELTAEFTLGNVSSSPGIFDRVKLDWVSSRHIRAGGSARFLDEALPYFPEEFRKSYGRSELARIFDVAAENLPCFSRLEEAISPFRRGAAEFTKLDGRADVISPEEDPRPYLENAAALFEALAAELESLGEWNAVEIKSAIKRAGSGEGVKGKALFMPIRAAVTGEVHGPDLATIIEIRGREDVISALRAARKD
jgi:nondiscriminating glutamyl-tRNA synthetase